MGDLSRIEILPQAFLSRMREMLGDEYEEFSESYIKSPVPTGFVSIHQKSPAKNLKSLFRFR